SAVACLSFVALTFTPDSRNALTASRSPFAAAWTNPASFVCPFVYFAIGSLHALNARPQASITASDVILRITDVPPRRVGDARAGPLADSVARDGSRVAPRDTV